MRIACSLVMGICLLAAPAAARADGEGPPPAKRPAGPVTLEVHGERDVLQKAADALGQQTGAQAVAWEGEVLRLTFDSAEAAEKARALCKELGLKVRKPKAPGEPRKGEPQEGAPRGEGQEKKPRQEPAGEPGAEPRPVIEGRVFEASPEQLEQAVKRLKEAFPAVKARVREGVLVLAARERKEFDGAVALLGQMGLRVAEPRGPGGPGMPGMDARGTQVQMSPERAAELRIDGLERRLVEARQAGREREVAELERALDRARDERRAAQARGGERREGREPRPEGRSELEGLRQRMQQAREALAEAEQRDARRQGDSRLEHARQALEHLQAAGMDGLAQMVRAAIGRMEQGLRRLAQGREAQQQGREAMAQRMRMRQGPPEGMGPQGAPPWGMGPRQGRGEGGPQQPRMGPGGMQDGPRGALRGGARGAMRGGMEGGPQGPMQAGPQGPPPAGATWGRLPPGAPPSVGGVRRGQIFLPHPVIDAPQAPQPMRRGPGGPWAQQAGPQGPPAPGEQRGMDIGMGPMGPGGMQRGPQRAGQRAPQGPGHDGPQGRAPRGMQRGPQGTQAGPQGAPQGEIQALRQEVEELRKQLRYLLMERLDRPQGR